METKMETIIWGLGFRGGSMGYIEILEKKMEATIYGVEGLGTGLRFAVVTCNAYNPNTHPSYHYH